MTSLQTPAKVQNPTDETLLAWRFNLARRLFQTITIIAIPATLAASYYALDEGTYSYILIYAVIIVFMLVVAFWKRISDHVRIWGIMGLIYFIILLDFYTEGRGSLARAFVLTLSFMGAIFYGRRGAIISSVIGVLTMVTFAYLFVSGALPDYQVSSLVTSGWISNTVIVVLLITVLTFSVNYLMREMLAFLAHSQQLNQIVEADRASLEQRVQERTAAAEAARADAESARREAEAQAWYTLGQARLAEKIRGDLDVPTLANNVTSFLCQYLGAHTGALFLVSGDMLKLTGRYAYAERANRKSEFRFGENLIGEAARLNQQIRLDGVSDSAVWVSSALGEAKPNQILIAPIAVDGQVFAVVELATLGEFTAEHENFLSRVSESVAIAFRTAHTRLRMNDLLEQSQAQAEELRAQEEELRAANEEFPARAKNRNASRNSL